MIKYPGFILLTLLLGAMFNVALAESLAPQQFAEFDQCDLIGGGVLAPCKVGYRTHGELNADKSNAILVPTWFTGTSEAHAFLAAPALLDPGKYFIIIVDALGNGVSSSPSNSVQANESFPRIAITDMVESQHRLVTETLGIESLHALVGLSMGGMQAFEWSVRHPGFAEKTVAVIGSPRLPTYDIALWATGNSLLALWRECQCEAALEARAGFRMTTAVPIRLSQEVPRTAAAATIKARAAEESLSIATSWDIERQAEAMIGHNIARDFDNDMARAAAQTDTEFLIILGADDRVVTPQPAIDFAALTESALIVLDEDCGHGDPWCAPDDFATAVASFVNRNDD